MQIIERRFQNMAKEILQVCRGVQFCKKKVNQI